MYRKINNCKSNIKIPPAVKITPPTVNILIEEKRVNNLTSPETWGPAMWFLNHLGSVNAPEIIPPNKRQKYWNYIDGLPEILPCKKCSNHARAYVDKISPYKDIICSTRDNLVKFFVDFHNSVNERNGKPTLTCEEVYKMFSGPAKIQKMNYRK